MQVIYEQAVSKDDEKAVIRAVSKTDEIQAAINLLESSTGSIAVTKDDQTYMLNISSIYYIESVDKRTFIYTKDNCYETKYKLYELENILNMNFLRSAKAMIVNIRKIKSVKSDINGRMNARLLNDESVVIARSYVKDLKKRLGI
ncbi:MAG: LytTR family transcriptional regulator DNA-binding domain-containing protein [Lachnospiraceae bacterium]|nr:LytTR family transcriptional regulator DNA-binding domain-containing protein [Lachnospiraceae bacterium]